MIDKGKITCYGCKKVGHFKEGSKEISLQEKYMMSSRDDSKQSNSKEKEEYEEANAYLMTSSNTKKVITSDSRQTCKNMKIMFDNLLEDTNILSKKCLFQKDKSLS